MQKFFLAIVLLDLLAFPVMGQDKPRFEVFGGYQYLHASNFVDTGLDVNANGWNASATVNFNKYFGLAADFSGNYKTEHTPVPGVHVYSYTFGPVVSLNSGGNFQPFAHALFGGAHLSPSPCDILSGSPIECPSHSENGVAMMLGGGVDGKITRSISLRLFQFDWVYLHSNHVGESKNVRVSTGVVFRF